MAGIGRAIKNSIDDAAEGLRKFGDDLRLNQKRQAKKVNDDVEAARNLDGSTNPPDSKPNVPSAPHRTITLKPKKGWSANQKREFQEKVDRMNRENLYKPAVKETRGRNFRKEYESANGPVSKSQDVDHIQELQLGGKDSQANAWALDRSVNRSVGAQVRHRIKDDVVNTTYDIKIDWGPSGPPAAAP